MSQESLVDDALSLEELGEVLAEAADETPEEIEQGAKEFEIGPPWEAEAIEFGAPGPLDEPGDGEWLFQPSLGGSIAAEPLRVLVIVARNPPPPRRHISKARPVPGRVVAPRGETRARGP